MQIRRFDPDADMADLTRCVIEIQDYERAIVPSMPSGDSICAEYISQMLQKCERYTGCILVAVVNDRVVGYISVFSKMVSDEIDDGNEEFGQIGDVVVLEKHRANGYGKRLIEEAHELARAQGVSILRIGVLGQNKVAVDLYRSLGFEVFSLQLQKSI